MLFPFLPQFNICPYQPNLLSIYVPLARAVQYKKARIVVWLKLNLWTIYSEFFLA